MTAAIELHGVCKTYPHFRLQNIDLVLPTGTITGFIGPNGAGKSTTIRILLGLVRSEAGSVRLLGRPMPAEQCAIKKEVGFVSEDMRLYPNATIGWHMGFVQSFCPSWDSAAARRLLDRFRLIEKQKVKELSHGQRVKAALLLALARQPRLLILDEPTTGLDPVVRSELLQELMEVLRDEERSVFFSSHNTLDLEQISDQIVFLNDGVILESGNKEDFLDSWRRVRFEMDPAASVPVIGERHDLDRQGRLSTLTTGDFSDEYLGRLESAGASGFEVERMTLEEIFLARVTMTRRGRAA